MKVGFYAGSFDPFTVGHLHLVKVSSKLFDKVIIGMGVNSKKTRRFDKELMKQGIENLLQTENITNAEVVIFDGLTCDVAMSLGAEFLIRGIRNGVDYDFEENLALINEEISGLDTIYIRAGKYGAISSSMVVELMSRNKPVDKYVPKEILKLIQK